MSIRQESIEYRLENQPFKGFLAYPETVSKLPCIIIAHAWMGQDDFARQKALELASLGYIAFAADVYGDGKCVSTSDEASALMAPLFINRSLLRKRIVAAYQAALSFNHTDPERMGAIGFCFGGQTVLELLRSGVSLKGIVSFHGVLGDSVGPLHAKREPSASTLKGSCLILHGFDDPLVTFDDCLALQKELTESQVDWQFHTFGQTTHAFTNPQANDPQNGLLYNPKSCERSWLLMKQFFKEVL